MSAVNIDDLSSATGLRFVAVLTDRGEFYARTPDGAVVVAPVRRGVRVTVFSGSEVVRRRCAARLFVVADTIVYLRSAVL